MPGKGLKIFSWALYDFANAIFGMNVLAFSFALWVTVEKGAPDIVYSTALGVSMFLAALSMPVLGAISDRRQRRMPYLILFTTLSVASLAVIGLLKSLTAGIVLFCVSNFGYLLSGAVFYNALLAYVADDESIGRVSGYGVSLSYAGTILGLLAVRPFALRFGYQATFIPTAAFFLIFALPCFIFVKDRKAREIPGSRLNIAKEAMSKLHKTFRDIRNSRDLFFFFLSIFIIINAVNAVFIFMSVYLKKVFLFADSDIISLYILSTVFSIIGAIIAGILSDRIGAKRTLSLAVLICCAGVLSAALCLSKPLFWVIGPLVALSFAGVRVAGRAMTIELFPKDTLGEAFGILGLLSNLAFIGFLVWGLTAYFLEPLGALRYRIALGILLAILVSGVIILQKVSDERSGHDSEEDRQGAHRGA